jgi:hypothetical protein
VSALAALIARDRATHLPPPVTEFAAAISGKLPGTAAVLFYGSCLRTGHYWDGLLDFYVLVDDYQSALGHRLSAWGNRLLPPNVYYAEQTDTDGQTLRCKYAVMSVADFRHWCSPKVQSPYIWARFAQPCAIAFARGPGTGEIVGQAVTEALKTLVTQTAPALAYPCDLKTFWSQVFALTYATEFRAERAGKGTELFDLFADRYAALTPLIFADLGLPLRLEAGQVMCSAIWPDAAVLAGWGVRGVTGRIGHVARLVKAAFTFDGGVDYLAWKISRHSGHAVTVTDWQRRHPVLGSIGLFLRLKRQGAIR